MQEGELLQSVSGRHHVVGIQRGQEAMRGYFVKLSKVKSVNSGDFQDGGDYRAMR